MATQFVRTAKPVAPVPFLLGQGTRGSKPARDFAGALKAAAAAVASKGDARNPRLRIALLLCELGKALGCRRELPLSRTALANALGISLVRVKRTLALLSLSGVIETDGETIEVLDWRKLGAAARFDPSALGLDDEEEEDMLVRQESKVEQHFLTASGDPACFV